MLAQRKKPDGKFAYLDVVSDIGNIDYVTEDGEISRNAACKAVMVRTESDLDLLDGYETGTVAFTAGFNSLWQKDSDGEWQSM